MRNRAAAVLCALAVIALGVGARRVAESAWHSVVDYRTPYHFHAGLQPGPRLAERVVLATIDGLRLDVSRRLTYLNQLRGRGADVVMSTGRPSLSNPARATMATGAGAHIHGITSNSAKQAVEADSVFSRARAGGLSTALAGITLWLTAFSRYLGDSLPPPPEPHVPPAQLNEWQKRQCGVIFDFVRKSNSDFLALDWTAGDIASHDYGPLSPEAGQIYSTIDDCLRDLVGALQPGTLLLVASDHGHIRGGGHGGSEPEVVQVPLVVVGGPTRVRLRLFGAHQRDIAPTVCALLGLPLPSMNEGRILAELFELDAQTVAQLKSLEERQKNAFASYRDTLLGGTPEQAQARARRARTLPALALLLVVIVGVMAIGVLVLQQPGEWRAALVLLGGFYAIYFLLFYLTGLGYSLSAINKEELLARYFFKSIVVAGAALLLAHLLAGLAAGIASVRLAVAGTLLLSLSLSAQVVVIYWLDGLLMQPWLPSFNLLSKAYLDLLAAYTLAFAVLGTPPALWLGARLHRRFSAGVLQRHPCSSVFIRG